jgi:hypothetical protein
MTFTEIQGDRVATSHQETKKKMLDPMTLK